MTEQAAPAPIVVRRMTLKDFETVIRVWHESKQEAYPYLPLEQGRTLADDDRFFRERVVPQCDVWVAEQDGAILGFMALARSYIDRLYVHPAHQRKGVGGALLRQAMALSPAGLELHTHQKNVSAQAFYEGHGFRAAKFGISPAPESEPDIEYHWRP